MTDKFNDYQSLLGLKYKDAVKYLLKKYGPGLDNYFSEKIIQQIFKWRNSKHN